MGLSARSLSAPKKDGPCHDGFCDAENRYEQEEHGDCDRSLNNEPSVHEAFVGRRGNKPPKSACRGKWHRRQDGKEQEIGNIKTESSQPMFGVEPAAHGGDDSRGQTDIAEKHGHRNERGFSFRLLHSDEGKHDQPEDTDGEHEAYEATVIRVGRGYHGDTLSLCIVMRRSFAPNRRLLRQSSPPRRGPGQGISAAR